MARRRRGSDAGDGDDAGEKANAGDDEGEGAGEGAGAGISTGTSPEARHRPPPCRGRRRMAALFGDMAAARRAAQEAFTRFARGGGKALYLSMGTAGLAWLDSLGGGMPEEASVGAFVSIAEVPGLIAGAVPGLAGIGPANRPGAEDGWAHARALGMALYEADVILAEAGGRALLVCESYGVPGAGGAGRVRCLSQLRRFCGEFIECGEQGR